MVSKTVYKAVYKCSPFIIYLPFMQRSALCGPLNMTKYLKRQIPTYVWQLSVYDKKVALLQPYVVNSQTKMVD